MQGFKSRLLVTEACFTTLQGNFLSFYFSLFVIIELILEKSRTFLSTDLAESINKHVSSVFIIHTYSGHLHLYSLEHFKILNIGLLLIHQWECMEKEGEERLKWLVEPIQMVFRASVLESRKQIEKNNLKITRINPPVRSVCAAFLLASKTKMSNTSWRQYSAWELFVSTPVLFSKNHTEIKSRGTNW